MRDLQVRRWPNGRWVATSVLANYKTCTMRALGAWGATRIGAVARLAVYMVSRGLQNWAEGTNIPGTENENGR